MAPVQRHEGETMEPSYEVHEDDKHVDEEGYVYETAGDEEQAYEYYGEEVTTGYGEQVTSVTIEEEVEEEEDEEEEDEEEEEEEEVEETAVEDTLGKSHLMPFNLNMIDQRVRIQIVEGKGRCLFVRGDTKPGEIVFVEGPLMAAIPSVDMELWKALQEINEEEPLSMPPIWHLGAICSLTKLELPKQRAVHQKFVPDPDAPPSADVLRVLNKVQLSLDAQKYERALNAWRFNGFGHHTETEGLLLYDRISNMAHSCCASATWHYGAEADVFVLRARQHLKAGEELTISYIGDEDLLKPTHVRREKLSHWQFTCHCDRCDDPVDRCRGFRCPDCGTGTVFMKTDVYEDEDEGQSNYTRAQPCTVCALEFDESLISKYENFEEAYIARLEETSKDYLDDLELVYQEAGRVFTQHHVMFELDTMLFEAYRDQSRYLDAAFHQQKRIEYAGKVRRGLRTKDVWMYEDLGDLLVNAAHQQADANGNISGFYKNAIMRAYESAFNGLIILCGADHEYTLSAHTKFETVSKSNQ